jgi:hypothetical protein
MNAASMRKLCAAHRQSVWLDREYTRALERDNERDRRTLESLNLRGTAAAPDVHSSIPTTQKEGSACLHPRKNSTPN